MSNEKLNKKGKSPTSFRLTKEALDMLDKLADACGVNRTVMLELAIREKASKDLKG